MGSGCIAATCGFEAAHPMTGSKRQSPSMLRLVEKRVVPCAGCVSGMGDVNTPAKKGEHCGNQVFLDPAFVVV
jgi:hypothetical protein